MGACPKCGAAIESGAVICPACDFLLDASRFLDDLSADIPMSSSPRPSPIRDVPELVFSEPITHSAIALPVPPIDGVAREAPAATPLPPPNFERGGAYGGEALILGDAGARSASSNGNDFESMLSDATGTFPIAGSEEGPVFEPAPVHIARNVQQMMDPPAVLAVRDGANPKAIALSPIEQHVLSFIDGQRPLARLQRKAGLSMNDLKIAIGMLADRQVIILKGRIKPNLRAMLDADDLDESSEHELPLAMDLVSAGGSAIRSGTGDAVRSGVGDPVIEDTDSVFGANADASSIAPALPRPPPAAALRPPSVPTPSAPAPAAKVASGVALPGQPLASSPAASAPRAPAQPASPAVDEASLP